MKRIFAAMALAAAAWPGFAQDASREQVQDEREVFRQAEEITTYQTRLAEVYFPARQDADERIQLMKNYFGREFSAVRYPDGTVDYVLIVRQYGNITSYYVLATSAPQQQ